MKTHDLTAFQREAARHEPKHHSPFSGDSRLASNYAPIPLDIIGSKYSFAWNAKGQFYFDALSCYGATNFGHLNDHIVRAIHDQIDTPDFVTDLLDSG